MRFGGFLRAAELDIGMALEDFLFPLKGAYGASPAWIKASLGRLYALLPMRIRYGQTLTEAIRFLDQSQWWSWEQQQSSSP